MTTAVKGIGIDGNAMSLATGYSNNCAILNDNSIKCWGYNLAQFWPGSTNSDPHKLVATEVVAVDQYKERVNKIIIASYTGFALLDDGTLHTFGANNNGMQGLGTSSQVGTTKNTINSAEQVIFPSTACPTLAPTISPTKSPTQSPSVTPTSTPCPENESRLTADILTDNCPGETEWTLV